MKKYIRVLLLAALVCSLLAGCSIETKSSKDSQDESKYYLYYLNESETVLREEPYSPGEETADFMVKDLMQKLGSKDAPDGEIRLQIHLRNIPEKTKKAIVMILLHCILRVKMEKIW